jgi:hypothetical protein
VPWLRNDQRQSPIDRTTLLIRELLAPISIELDPKNTPENALKTIFQARQPVKAASKNGLKPENQPF